MLKMKLQSLPSLSVVNNVYQLVYGWMPQKTCMMKAMMCQQMQGVIHCLVSIIWSGAFLVLLSKLDAFFNCKRWDLIRISIISSVITD